jgi:hypothetical protein
MSKRCFDWHPCAKCNDPKMLHNSGTCTGCGSANFPIKLAQEDHVAMALKFGKAHAERVRKRLKSPPKDR